MMTSMQINKCVYSIISIQSLTLRLLHTGSHWIIDAETGNAFLYPLSLSLRPCTKSISVLQAISRPPQSRYECSLNSRGPLGPLSTASTWWVASAPVHTNRTVISRCANQRAAGVRCFCFLRCAASCLLRIKGLLLCGQGGLVPLADHCEGPWLCPLGAFVFYSAASRQLLI